MYKPETTFTQKIKTMKKILLFKRTPVFALMIPPALIFSCGKKSDSTGGGSGSAKTQNDIAAIDKAVIEAENTKGKPTMIVLHTIKGKGVSFMENQAGWHGMAPKPEEAEQALKELGF